MAKLSMDMPWVIFYLMNGQFGISANHVREMVAMPKIVPIPKTPFYIRGVINLRGKVMPVMDLRQKMGMRSLMDETENLIKLMEQREEDHKRWIEELQSSVQNKCRFTLATDPNECAFGMWFNHFRTDNRVLENCLKKFIIPHQKIHSIASKVMAMVDQKDYEGALSIIEQTRENELEEMIGLFAEIRSLLRESNREIALVLEWDGKIMVISVDSVAAVEKISVAPIEDMPELAFITDSDCFSGMGKRGKNDELVQLFNVDSLIGQEKELFQTIENKG